MTITKYQVVESVELGNLEAEVEKLLKYGWQPFGELVVYLKQGTIPRVFYHHVMVRYAVVPKQKLT